MQKRPFRYETSHMSRIEAPASRVFEWHASEGALLRLCPPWERVRVLDPGPGLRDGSRATIGVGIGPFTMRWIAEHRDLVAGRQFRDVQISGPFTYWDHLHRISPDGPEAAILEDRVRWTPPGGALGAMLLGKIIHERIEKMFRFRHRRTREDAASLAAGEGRSLEILISGSTGLVGSSLVPLLTSGGHRVVRMVRSGRPSDSSILWDPVAGISQPERLEGFDAVVHLAGENIAGRWSRAKKERIRASRVEGTRVLCDTLSRLERPPRMIACASATGFCGDRGDERLDETSSRGPGFLPGVCSEWEEACLPAIDAGIRVASLRFGVILTPEGGALARMLPAFHLGAGGRIGTGRQFMSWISIDDAVGAILHAILDETLEGPVNVVSPHPVRNSDLASTLARVLSRPALVPLPAAMARLAFGEMAGALLLSSTRVSPDALLGSGYRFRQPDLEDALRHLLGRTEDAASRLESGERGRAVPVPDRDGE